MLSRSFLAEEYAAAKEGKYQAMEACLPVLEGTSLKETYRSLGKRWDRYVDQPLTRYDMAQIIYNLVLEKDALQETIQLSTTDIADWTEIPDGCHTAVFTCWGMGLLKGPRPRSSGPAWTRCSTGPGRSRRTRTRAWRSRKCPPSASRGRRRSRR